MPKIFVNGQF